MAKNGTEATFSKNGYEIRNDVLDMATNFVKFKYDEDTRHWELKFGIHEVDNEGKKLWSDIALITRPAVPDIEDVLEAAKMFYEFVNKHQWSDK